MLHHYRPQLAKLLYDMELIAEVAELAAETEKEGFDSYLSSQIIAGKKNGKRRILYNEFRHFLLLEKNRDILTIVMRPMMTMANRNVLVLTLF